MNQFGVSFVFPSSFGDSLDLEFVWIVADELGWHSKGPEDGSHSIHFTENIIGWCRMLMLINFDNDCPLTGVWHVQDVWAVLEAHIAFNRFVV